MEDTKVIQNVREENKLLRDLIRDIPVQEYLRLKKENLELQIYKSMVDNNINDLETIKMLHKEEIARIKAECKLHISEIKESHANALKCAEYEEMSLRIENHKLQTSITLLSNSNNELATKLAEKHTEIEILEKSLQEHKNRSEMLEKELNEVKGVKEDTKKILNLVDNLYNTINELENVRGISDEDVCKLTRILIENERLILTSTKGKSIARDIGQIKEWINIAKDVINNDGSCSVELAKKHGLSSTPALASKLKTIKNNGIYDLVSDYLRDGLSEELINKYGTTHRDEIDILKEEE